jgi:hypothetical protein
MILQMLSEAKYAKLALESDFFCQMSEANCLQKFLPNERSEFFAKYSAIERSEICRIVTFPRCI